MKSPIIFIYLFALVCTTLFSTDLYGQYANNSVLKKEPYLVNPKLYLSQLDSTKIQSGILIDRTIFDELLLHVNGVEQVTGIDCSDWAKIYNTLRVASYDTTAFINYSIIQQIYDSYYIQGTYTISLLDFRFDKIKQSALDNSELIESGTYLLDNKASVNSYSNHRAVAASCGEHNIVGDHIRFTVPDYLYFTNNKSQKLNKIEIDFGNGTGFQTVVFNETIDVDYSDESRYTEGIVKLHFENKFTHATEICYSHFSFFRTGTSTVPMPDFAVQPELRSTPLPPDTLYGSDAKGMRYYPVRQVITKEVHRPNGPQGHSVEFTVRVTIGGEIEYCFLFAPKNKSGKLRRPFIIVDGFDPGNTRNYYETRYPSVSDLLPKERDFRGLFQLLNGDPSPWYSNPDVNLVWSLRDEGYDLVFVNFKDGAGDIPTNANHLRGFLNDVINSPTYRDAKTEESILVGPSMGGIISRYALTSMEQANPKENHFVKLWISFDSPHKGAYIPIGLQHSINFLQDIHDGLGLISSLKDAKASFAAGVSTLNTAAAKQMLLAHYSQTNSKANPAPEFNSLYNMLNQLGYPKYTKNYAITNGGQTKLYAGDRVQILDFEIDYPLVPSWAQWTWANAWSNTNTDGSYKIFEGSRQGANNDEDKSTNSQIGYENAPGGWNASLYMLNCQDDIENKKSDTDTQYTRATFMVTSSAFGKEVTRDNVYKTWEAYTGCSDNTSGKIKTPFDFVRGMVNNEEHVRISESTANYLINSVLHPEFDNLVRPVARSGETVAQPISGNVAYVAKQTVTLGGNGNSLTVKSGAEVNVVAGNSIHLLPGFKAEAGSTFRASIENVTYENTLKSSKVPTESPTKAADYSQPSPFRGNIFDYSAQKNRTFSNLVVFPNPVKDILHIQLTDISTEPIKIEIVDLTGKIVWSQQISGSDTYDIDCSAMITGIYIVKASNSSIYKTCKIIKL